MSIAENIQRVQARIQNAAHAANRDPNDITLIAVSKQKPIDQIEAAIEAGLRSFGENRAPELAEKAAHLAHIPDVDWHFIGHLQTRQSLPVAQNGHMFHAVDRLKIAKRLSNQLDAAERSLPVFLEINVSGEATKGGFDCSNWETDKAQQDAIQQAAATIVALPRIEVRGLMTMAPWGAEEAVIQRVFERTRALAEWLKSAAPAAQWDQFSMGMTDDFELAIKAGATHVRVGRAIFGERNY